MTLRKNTEHSSLEKKTILAVLSFFIFLFPYQGEAFSQENSSKILQQLENTFSEIIEQARPSVVYLQVTRGSNEHNSPDIQNPNNAILQDFFGETSSRKKPQDALLKKSIFGSGFLLNSDGYIVTNSHVIRNAQKVTAVLADRTHHHAKVIGEDQELDIALLKIEGKGYPHLTLGDSSTVKTGNWALAIGSPYKYIQTVTSGIISATSRNSVGVSGFEHFIQTDAAINPGNSGGPLLNIFGQVIGVNTAFMTRTGGYMGVGFAVPANMVRQITLQLMASGKVTRGWIGLSLVDATTHFSQQQVGQTATETFAKIITVQHKSPAEKAGLQEGDLLSTINENRIWGAADFRNQITLYPPGSLVTIGFYRNETFHTTKTILGGL